MNRYTDIRRSGAPETIHKVGSTRYKYDHAVWIEEIWDVAACRRKWGADHYRGLEDGDFCVWQAGNPNKFLGKARSLEDAEDIARREAKPVGSY